MSALRAAHAVAMLAATLALSACGGGGGGDSQPDFQVAFDTGVFETAWDDEIGRSGTMLFDVAPVPTADPVVVVVDGGGFFTAGPAGVSAQPGGGYAAFLPYPDSAPAGTYSGTVVVRVCEDAACQRPYALPPEPLTYDANVFHVETGLPPLTATFLLDGAAVTDAVEGVNLEGERTYTVAAHLGQLLDITVSEQPMIVRRPITGVTATLTSETSTFSVLRYRITAIQSGLTSGVAILNTRVADGRWLRLTVDVTP